MQYCSVTYMGISAGFSVDVEGQKTNELMVVAQPQSVTLKAIEETVNLSVAISGGKAPYTYNWVIEKEYDSNFEISTSPNTTRA